ncbi:unnamed protein product [Owenia fusiformis]|uniref:Uncharacterized protein n=1 Tax=Owenia fusiformis TaxID=6347 RepID=A0A8J1TAQ6_OWEFU|nr:unnamed protein product [Owenia fusiformis]
MEPTPPRKPKQPLSFYEAPEHVKTSSKIISEARQQVRGGLDTERPFTPQDGKRSLFGGSSRGPESRPPSAFSLGARHFDGTDSRPTSGIDSRPVSGTRLLPLSYEPRVPSPPKRTSKVPRPPADPNRPITRKGSRSKQIGRSDSMEECSQSIPPGPISSASRAGSLTDVTSRRSYPTTPDVNRRVHSGPKERTTPLEERGVADGGECEPRVISRQSNIVPDNTGTSSRQSSAEKTGSAGRKEDETPEEALYFNTNILPILDHIATLVKDKDTDLLHSLTCQLHEKLEEGKMLGRNCKRRSAILKTVFKILDSDDPKLLIRVARVVLQLKVTANNLTNVCKLIFKVSRNERNDQLFLKDTIIEDLLPVVTIDHNAQPEALVYCIGALKFLSGNSTIVKHMSMAGCISALGQQLAAINKANAESSKPSGTGANVLVQLTATLRNLANVSNSRQEFLDSSIMENLCPPLISYPSDVDLALNVSRILSKLTTHTDCCAKVCNTGSYYKAFLNTLATHRKNEDLVVRVGFILGNLTAKSENAREQLFAAPKALETLLAVFKHYLLEDLQESNASKDQNQNGVKTDNLPSSKTEDVLTKLLRVIANLSINEMIGSSIATNRTCIKYLIQILENKDISQSEELILNTMVTLNNLTYYPVKKSAIVDLDTELTEACMKLMLADHMEGMAEAGRVFGNLTRRKTVRDILVNNKVDEMMVALLDSGSREVVFTACGVMINIMVDEEKRAVLKQEGGIRKLVDVLRDFGRNDWQLATMVCQILWNYSSKITSTNSCFGEEESSDLNDLLLEFLDEETAMAPSFTEEFDEEMREFFHENWETDFCPVASQLLNRIEEHQSDFEPL